MTFHIAAFGPGKVSSVAPTYTTVPAVPESAIAVSPGGNVILTAPATLVGAFAISESTFIGAVRVNSSTLRGVSPVHIRPLSASVASTFFGVPSNPNFGSFAHQTTRLAAQEEIGVEAAVAVAKTADVAYAFLLLQDQFEPLPSGPGYWIRIVASAGSGISSASWQPVHYTFEQSLSDGTYAIAGMDVQAPAGTGSPVGSLLAARLVFDTPQAFRPGTIVTASSLPANTASLYDRTADDFYRGRFGCWGRFGAFSPPRLEVFAAQPIAANITFSAYLDVIKLT